MTVAYSTYAWISGLFCGMFTFLAVLDYRRESRRHKALRQSWQGLSSVKDVGQGAATSLLAQLVHYDLVHGGARANVERAQAERVRVQRAKAAPQDPTHKDARLIKQMRQAGLGEVRPSSARMWRLCNACIGAVVCGMLGLALNFGFALLAAGLGFLLGWASLGWALRTVVAQRTQALERHLSEAIEVMCLGLRAGLSFERSLELYCANFPSQLSAELHNAQQMWHTGLLTREAALRNLVASYQSVLFSRMVESIVRSMRFGSPLAGNLEDLAHEARKSHRAHVEEMVMKAPVKMMLPVGLLILPSMLLLVMGPIMLELMTGF